MKNITANKAQFILEYAVVFMIVALALLSMFLYGRFALQGKYRESVDVFGGGKQYAPGITEVTETISNVIIN